MCRKKQKKQRQQKVDIVLAATTPLLVFHSMVLRLSPDMMPTTCSMM